VAEKTYSLWGYLATRKTEFLNPLYQPEENNKGKIFPNPAPQNFRLDINQFLLNNIE
jgi:hypothetical protein